MNILRRSIAVVTVIGILATASFAAPMCAACAPFLEQHHVVQSSKPAHDHCGSADAGVPDGPSAAISQCGHAGSICMVAPERNPPSCRRLRHLKTLSSLP